MPASGVGPPEATIPYDGVTATWTDPNTAKSTNYTYTVTYHNDCGASDTTPVAAVRDEGCPP